jgi:hypothetical protein
LGCDSVIWRRFGKEHGEDDGFRVNAPEVVRQGLRGEIEKIRSGSSDRTWVRVSDKLIVERSNRPEGEVCYYLPEPHLLIIQNSMIVPEWPWYVHIGITEYDTDLACWVFTDHFVDVLVQADQTTHTVLDLDDLVNARSIGLLDTDEMNTILLSTQALLDRIREGDFPAGLIPASEGIGGA